MHATVCDQLYDLVQNALEAGSTLVEVDWTEERDRLVVSVVDNGCGMSESVRERALDPFYTDGRKHRRKVGLGLAFLRQMVEATGGEWLLESTVGEGTRVWFRLAREHLDVPPLGKLVEAFVGLMAFDGGHDLVVQRTLVGHSYRVSRRELQEAVGDLSLASSQALVQEYIASQEEALLIGKE